VTGLPDGVTVEIEFSADVWTDVTTYVAAEQRVSVRAGRSTEFGDVGPSTCTLVLRNDDGRFTPDSAGSPYYPDVIEGRRLRITVIKSDTYGFTGLVSAHVATPDTLWPGLPTDPTEDGSYRLFTGSILSWEPNYSSGALNTGTVTITANDALATLALHTFDSRWVEETRALARTAATWADVYVLKGDAATSAWDNIGVTVGADLGTATLVPGTAGVGEIAYGTPPLVLEGSAEFKPQGAGIVANIVPAGAPQAVSFWLQVPTDSLVGSHRVITLRDGSGEYGSVRLYYNGAVEDLTVWASGVSILPLDTVVPNVADAAWRLVTLTASAGSTVITVTGTTGTVSTYTAAFDLTAATSIVFGGERADGSQSYCPSFTAAGLCIAGDATVVPSYLRALPGQTYTHTALYAAYQTYVPELTTWATTGGEVRTIGDPVWAGQTTLAVLQTIARTINGVAYVDGSGDVTLAAADVVRPATSAASLDIEQDLDATSAMPTLRRAADSRPTRVTIGYAGGTTTLIDTVAEANNQPRREVKLETCAADTTGAAFAGSYLLQAANGLRITQVAVDLTTSVTDLWATFLGLYPTQRVTISGFDAALVGESTKVVFVQGWQVALDHQSLVYTLDCSPASQFVSAAWDAGDEYGRWAWGTGVATGTGGTAMGITGTGTLVITFTGGYGLTLDAAQYPLYLDWDGEAVRIDAPPAGSTSPQTVTIAARAQQNTAAQVHLVGEAVTVFEEAVWGF
jgi:hypothetical protein